MDDLVGDGSRDIHEACEPALPRIGDGVVTLKRAVAALHLHVQMFHEIGRHQAVAVDNDHSVVAVEPNSLQRPTDCITLAPPLEIRTLENIDAERTTPGD